MALPLERRPPVAAQALGVIGRKIAEAPAGGVIEIGSGTYREQVVISKPVTLIGVGRPVIDGGGCGDIVTITAPGVTMRGFVVRDTGIDLDQENAAIRVLAARATIEDNILEDILFGIDLRESPGSVVRGNQIGGKHLDIARRGDGLRLWRCDGAIVESNSLHDGRDAILWYSNGVTVRGNRSLDCRYGLHLMFSDDVEIEDNHLERNSVGIYLMYSTGVRLRHNWLDCNRGPSGYGIGLKETDKFVIEENTLAGNRAGIYLDGSPFSANNPGVIHRNTFACNDVGIMFLPSARNNEVTENNFIDNIDQVAVLGRGDLSANRFWVGEVGNYWSDYTGYDQDGNGVGDFVHEPQTLFENLLEKEPKLRLFLFSPAQQAIEFVGRALPSVRPEPKLTDEVPLMQPVAMRIQGGGPPGGGLALAGAGAMLMLVGAAVVTGARL